MRKIISSLLVVFLSVSTMISISACTIRYNNDYDISSDNIKNLIILIGDGMGPNHIHNAKTYFELDNQTFENGYITTLNTDSLTVDEPTDSAAAGTALATGVSVRNSRIGHSDTEPLKNIMEYASEKNMLTGIITDDALFGATPAAFSSHTLDRGNVMEIMTDQSNGSLDLLIGQYNQEYYSYASMFTSNGFAMVDNTNDLYTVEYPQKVIANINNVHSIYNEDYANQVNMLDLVKYAIDYLDNDDGFVLMVECAYIDKFSHGNELISALSEVRTLFDIANYIYDYIDNNPDTALIVTSDHETGGLQRTNLKAEISDDLYTTGNHTKTFVNLYAKGITTTVTETIKNTFVHEMACEVISKQ